MAQSRFDPASLNYTFKYTTIFDDRMSDRAAFYPRDRLLGLAADFPACPIP